MNTKFDEKYFHSIEKASVQERTNREFEHILAIATPRSGEKVLDIGCGTGAFGKTILTKNDKIEVFFSDISPVAEEYLKGFNFSCSPAENTDYPDDYFDKVYCLHTISHVVDKNKVAKELLRITKPGGTVVIIGPNKYYVLLMKLASFVGMIPKYNFDKTAKWLLTSNNVSRLLVSGGWKIVKVMYFGHYIKKLRVFHFLGLRVLAIAKKIS